MDVRTGTCLRISALTTILVLAATSAASAAADEPSPAGWRFTELPGLSEADDPKGRTWEQPLAVASGPHGTVAVGHASCRESGDCYARVWHSSRGEAWTALPLADGPRLGRTPRDLQDQVGPTSVTDGPAGFVAIGVARWRDRDGEPAPVYGVWHSPDGLRWARLESAPFGGAGHPRSIVATRERYVISGTENTGHRLDVAWPMGSEPGGQALEQVPVVWTSIDGRTWERSQLPDTRSGIVGPASVDHAGVVIPGAVCTSQRESKCYWSTYWHAHDAVDARGAMWRSPDGTTWERELVDGWDGEHGSSEVGWGSSVATLGGIVAVPGGVLREGAFEPWACPPDMLDDPDSNGTPLLATLGEQVVMLGDATCGPAAWSSSDGISWTRLPDPPFPDELLAEPLRDLAIVGGDELWVSGWAEADSSGFVLNADERLLEGPTEQDAATTCSDVGPFTVQLSAADGRSVAGLPAPACHATAPARQACQAQFPALSDIPQLRVSVSEPWVRLALADGSPFRGTVVYPIGRGEYPRVGGYDLDRSLPALACRAQTEQVLDLAGCARRATRTGRCERVVLVYLDVGCPGGLGTFALFRVLIES